MFLFIKIRLLYFSISTNDAILLTNDIESKTLCIFREKNFR